MKRRRSNSKSDESADERPSLPTDESSIKVGDFVVLRVQDHHIITTNEPDPKMIARVEGIWTEIHPGKSRPITRFRARWFLTKDHVERLFPTIGLSSKLSPYDLVLTNQCDNNAPETICDKVQVIYRRPESDERLPPFPNRSYLCRYQIEFGPRSKDIIVTPYDGEEDPLGAMLIQVRFVPKPAAHLPFHHGNADSSEGESDADDSENVGGRAHVDDEKIEQRNIRVGSKHQVNVPSSTAESSARSRNPTLVWKANGTSQDCILKFLEQSALTLNSYLIANQLTTNDPYSPLPWEEMERVTKADGSNMLPTLSSLCTSSSLSGSVKRMLREFDLDAMLMVLHQSDYSIDEALERIQKKPEDFLTCWTQTEKDAFDYSFQRHAGSLRMVFKRVKGSKSAPDIVDYHYRFKIPDQFRIFHNEKRDMSVRMVETMESRRNINSTIPIDNLNGCNGKSQKKKKINGNGWLRTSIADVTGALQERRMDAKTLLLEIESAISPEKYLRLMDVITDFHCKSSEEVLQEVEVILEGHSKLQAQFIDFLPDHLR
ncbi:unnamed protein product [Cylindrotheca closterium]|uniref:BAH domain-containing protein n=1 Tax=Cylindrotheca closterium TaxID=2856 RepID=A0AAD2GC36_9STRA|nr:unnamed protein product [Cylindrotheca closterium]